MEIVVKGDTGPALDARKVENLCIRGTQGQRFVQENSHPLQSVVEYLDMVVEMGRGKLERLLNVRLFHVGIIGEQFDAFGVGAKDFEHSPDRNPQTANAGLAPHFARFDGNPIKGRLQSHDLILSKFVRCPGWCGAENGVLSNNSNGGAYHN